jgi:hypothetical protein
MFFSPISGVQTTIQCTYLGDSILICTHRSDDTQCPGVDLLTPIANDANHDLLPPVLSPRLTPVPFTQMGNVLDDTMH